ncbi:hypothetical protein [Motiliproteus sediminis]|uniref:hypothetical protein n=1 Tax=Motiliproteus sediminis TaxID=1468178 RepID=UPI001AEF4EE3|nr:hypothetical protein [Motiliproteus sediminis]
MKTGVTVALCMVTLLLGCSTDSHDAQGRWSGVLINQGITVELGQLTIGKDFIEIPYLDERYEQLSFESRNNEVHFGRKSSANFQGEGAQISGRAAQGSIKLSGPDRGLMSFNRIQGTIRLRR